MKVLQSFHKPYEKISLRQIKQARAHARKLGPGSSVPKLERHRVRLDTNKVDHFIDFVNRPYFYQDVAFGTRTLTLNDGSQIAMPNVIQTVTRSTMIMQYPQYCKEESFEPVSRPPFTAYWRYGKHHNKSLYAGSTTLLQKECHLSNDCNDCIVY